MRKTAVLHASIPLPLFFIALLMTSQAAPAASYKAELASAHAAFAEGRMEEAGACFERARLAALGGKVDDLIYRIYQQRDPAVTGAPEVIQKILVHFYPRTLATDPALPERLRKEARIPEAKYASIELNLRLFARCVEVLSRGKIAVDLEIAKLDVTVTGITEAGLDINRDPILDSLDPFPAEELYAGLKEADLYFSFYQLPVFTNCHGGWDRFPLVPYTFESPQRGKGQFNTSNSISVRLIMHEYFHYIEAHFGLKSQDSFIRGDAAGIAKHYPDFPLAESPLGESAWDYYFWQLSTYIPAKIAREGAAGGARGWTRLAMAKSRPMSITDVEWKLWRSLTGPIPAEGLRAAAKLAEEGRALAKAEPAKAAAKFTAALALNPAQLGSLGWSARDAAARKEWAQALAFYERYIALYPTLEILLEAAKLGLDGAGEMEKGYALYEKALSLASGEERNRIEHELMARYCLMAGEWARALALSDGLTKVPGDRWNRATWFLRSYAACRLGRWEAAREAFGAAKELGLMEVAFWGERAYTLVSDLLAAGEYEKAAFFAGLSSAFTASAWGDQCAFLGGEALWQLGKRDEGKEALRRAVAKLASAKWKARYKAITGEAY